MILSTLITYLIIKKHKFNVLEFPIRLAGLVELTSFSCYWPKSSHKHQPDTPKFFDRHPRLVKMVILNLEYYLLSRKHNLQVFQDPFDLSGLEI